MKKSSEVKQELYYQTFVKACRNATEKLFTDEELTQISAGEKSFDDLRTRFDEAKTNTGLKLKAAFIKEQEGYEKAFEKQMKNVSLRVGEILQNFRERGTSIKATKAQFAGSPTPSEAKLQQEEQDKKNKEEEEKRQREQKKQEQEQEQAFQAFEKQVDAVKPKQNENIVNLLKNAAKDLFKKDPDSAKKFLEVAVEYNNFKFRSRELVNRLERKVFTPLNSRVGVGIRVEVGDMKQYLFHEIKIMIENKELAAKFDTDLAKFNPQQQPELANLLKDEAKVLRYFDPVYGLRLLELAVRVGKGEVVLQNLMSELDEVYPDGHTPPSEKTAAINEHRAALHKQLSPQVEADLERRLKAQKSLLKQFAEVIGVLKSKAAAGASLKNTIERIENWRFVLKAKENPDDRTIQQYREKLALYGEYTKNSPRTRAQPPGVTRLNWLADDCIKIGDQAAALFKGAGKSIYGKNLQDLLNVRAADLKILSEELANGIRSPQEVRSELTKYMEEIHPACQIIQIAVDDLSDPLVVTLRGAAIAEGFAHLLEEVNQFGETASKLSEVISPSTSPKLSNTTQVFKEKISAARAEAENPSADANSSPKLE